MTNRITARSPRRTARLAGLLYLLLVPPAIFGMMYVPATLIVPGDAAATAANIRASETLFRLGIVSTLINSICFTVLVLVLYKLLKPVNVLHALLMVFFVLVSVPIGMLNEVNRIAALLLLSGADHLTVFTGDQLHAQVMVFLDLHRHGIVIAEVLWGLWLFPLGYLVFKSGFFPRVLGILLMIACFGYLTASLTGLLFPTNEALSIIASIYVIISAFAEFAFLFWLLFKGVNAEQWEQRALQSA